MSGTAFIERQLERIRQEEDRVPFRSSIAKEFNVDHLMEETLVRRRHAIYACIMQIPVAIAAMALYFVRRTSTVLIINPFLIFAGFVGIWGSVNIDKLFSLAHAVLSFGVSILLIATGVANYARDSDDYVRLVIHIPIIIDIVCGIYSLRFYLICKRDPAVTAPEDNQVEAPAPSILVQFQQQYAPAVNLDALTVRQRLWVGNYVARTPQPDAVRVQVQNGVEKVAKGVSRVAPSTKQSTRTYREPASISSSDFNSSINYSSSSSSSNIDAESSFAEES